MLLDVALARLEAGPSFVFAHMSIHFLCPLGHQLSVPDDHAGQPGRCPVCQQRVFVPDRRPNTADDAKECAVKEAEESGTPSPDVPTQLRDKVPSKAIAVGVSSLSAQLEDASQERGMSALPPIQPPPNPWQGAVAAVAAPPPLPQVPLPDTTPSAVPAASVPATPPPNRLPVRWLAWEKADSLEGRAISRPDPRQLEVAYWLASLLPFATAFSAAPALPHMHFAGTPIWAQLMLFAAVVQIGYAAWLALLPDVSTIRVGLYLFAASAVAGLAAMLAILLLNNSQLSALNLSGMRGAAVAWCGLVFVVASLTSAACGWIATHWQDMG